MMPRAISLVIAAAWLTLAVHPSSAQEVIDNDTISIIDWFPAFNGYDVEFAIDTGDDRFISDYASQGGADETFIEFDLGKPHTLTEIIMTDRVTSGGPNFAWFGGLFDYNRIFSYTLSVDDDFNNGDGIVDDIFFEVEAEEPEFSPVLEEEIEFLQTSTSIPNVTVQFVRWDVVETDGNNPGANDFQFFFRDSLPGDFNDNGGYDAGDMDLLSIEVGQGTNAPAFDLNGDGLVNQADRDEWVNVLANTYVGDANLDGEFNSSDLVVVFTAGEYEDGVIGNSGWAAGDWNGDSEFDSSDIVAAFTAGGYELGPRPATTAVPEPSAAALLVTIALVVGYLARH